MTPRNNAAVRPIRVEDPSRNGTTYSFDSALEVVDFIKAIYWTDCLVVRDLHWSDFDLIRSIDSEIQVAEGVAKVIQLSHYDPDTGVLVVTLPGNGPAYGDTIWYFERFFDSFSLQEPGCSISWRGQYFTADREGRKLSYGESFWPWEPSVGRRHPSGRPSITLEAGVNYPLELMREKAKWWLRNSTLGINVVLLVKVDKGAATVCFGLWTRSPFEVPPQSAPLTAPRAQEVEIRMDVNRLEKWMDDENGLVYSSKSEFTVDDRDYLVDCCEVISETKELTVQSNEVFDGPAPNDLAEEHVLGTFELKALAAFNWIESVEVSNAI
jgi:hypothetical protein